MKKIILMLVISIMMCSFVSAGFWQNLVGSAVEVMPACTDTDGGQDYFVKGTTSSMVSGEELNPAEDACFFQSRGSESIPDACNEYGVCLLENYCGVEGNREYEILVCENGCFEGACLRERATCEDTDGGKDFFVKGTITGLGGDGEFTTETDYCSEGTAYEYYCDSFGRIHLGYQACEFGCDDGACIKESSCTDSDGGRDYYTKGIATKKLGGLTSDVCQMQTGRCSGSLCNVDSCSGEDCVLIEAICDNNEVSTTQYSCPNGCRDGACVQKTADLACEISYNSMVPNNATCTVNYYNQEASCIIKAADSGGYLCVPQPEIRIEQPEPNEGFSPVPGLSGYFSGIECSKIETSYNGDRYFVNCVNTLPCKDSDGGQDFFEKGTLVDKNGKEHTDYCGEGGVYEYSCDYEGSAYTYWQKCDYGCSDGACLRGPISECPEGCECDANGNIIECEIIPVTCKDTDGGKNIYEAGEAMGETRGYVDNCNFLTNEKGTLFEAVCEDNAPVALEMKCPSEAPYCNRGVCSASPGKCTDTDGGANPSVKGTITEPRYKDGPQHTDYCQNMETKQPWNGCSGENCGIREYYCPDVYRTTSYKDIQCIDGCRDGVCKRGPVPECPENCVCVDDTIKCEAIPDECPENCRCDEDGNIIECKEVPCPENCICEEGKIIECKVTPCPVDCKCDRYGKVIECKDGPIIECPEECICFDDGSMSCADDPERKCFQSCYLEGNCISYGIRVKDMYCDLDQEMRLQKDANEECNNNYECSTNLCIDSKCVSSGVWRRFLNWITNIFG